jgi:hypothetical protein
VTAPIGNPGPDNALIEQRFARIEQELAALRQKPLTNGGAISIKAPNGVTTFLSGPNGMPLADGSPQWMTVIRDYGNVARFAVYDPEPIIDGFQQATYMWDHLGGILFTSDKNGGIAEPWLPVVMYPKFSPPSGLYSYRARPVDGTERSLWEGRIGYLSHPRIQVDGVWGPASGTNTTRYKLKMNGTIVGQWDVAGLSLNVQGPFDTTVGAALRSTNVGIELTAQTLSGTGDYACQVWACYQRQT